MNFSIYSRFCNRMLVTAYLLIFPVCSQVYAQDNLQAIHELSVELYRAGKYEEALPLMERAAELSKGLDQRRPEVVRSYLFLAHAYLKSGFIYAVPSSKSGGGIQFVVPSPISDRSLGALVILGTVLQTIERDMQSKNPGWTLQNLEQIAELCRSAQVAIAQEVKQRAGMDPQNRYRCEVVPPRVAIFDTRIDQYIGRAELILKQDRNLSITKDHDIFATLVSFYRATGRIKEATTLEALLERR